MSSLQTTEARIEAQACESEWRGHRLNCHTCQRAARQRHWTELCAEGDRLLRAKRESTRKLERERELDRLPAPDQEPLFPGIGQE
jgi:hypothetical protein